MDRSLLRQNPLRKRNNLELSWLEPVVANAGPPRRNFAVRIGVGAGTATAHITGSRLRQTITVFCSPGDRTGPTMQFFGPQNCGAVPGGLPTSRWSEDCYGFPRG